MCCFAVRWCVESAGNPAGSAASRNTVHEHERILAIRRNCCSNDLQQWNLDEWEKSNKGQRPLGTALRQLCAHTMNLVATWLEELLLAIWS